MKLIIAGSRNISPSFEFIGGAIRLLKPYRDGPITEVVCGMAEGVDIEGEHWASHMNVPVEPFKADWNDLEHPNAVIKTRKDGSKYNAAAGPIRNRQMAEYGDALLLIWNGESRGSASMKREMEKLGKPVYEVILRDSQRIESKN